MTSNSSQLEQEVNDLNHVRREVDRLIAEAQQGCVDRGVDPISGKRGTCHSFKANSDVCLCGAMSIEKERMR